MVSLRYCFNPHSPVSFSYSQFFCWVYRSSQWVWAWTGSNQPPCARPPTTHTPHRAGIEPRTFSLRVKNKNNQQKKYEHERKREENEKSWQLYVGLWWFCCWCWVYESKRDKTSGLPPPNSAQMVSDCQAFVVLLLIFCRFLRHKRFTEVFNLLICLSFILS